LNGKKRAREEKSFGKEAAMDEKRSGREGKRK
jgi:hypothetical protein